MDLSTIIFSVAAGAVALLVNDIRSTMREVRDELRDTNSRLRTHELSLAAHKARCEVRHAEDA